MQTQPCIVARMMAVAGGNEYYAYRRRCPVPPAPNRVVVLPFTANSQEDISFVVKGLRDMLASRLPWQDKVTVVEPDLVAPVLKKFPPPYNDAKAREIGKEISANVVVYGSITKLGKSVSVDARVVKVDQPGPALTAFVHAKDLDAVIPQINQLRPAHQRRDIQAARRHRRPERSQGGRPRPPRWAAPPAPAAWTSCRPTSAP